MPRFILRRLLHFIPLLFGITLISFFVIQLAPGNYFDQVKLDPKISQETIQQLETRFGFDQPLVVQYFRWLFNVMRLDFGYSLTWQMPVYKLIKQRLWNTLLLAFWSMLFTWILSIPLGIFSAVRQYTGWDNLISVIAFLGMSIPNFFLAFLLIYFAATSGWFPIGGLVSLNYEQLSFWGQIWDKAHHLVIPVVVLGTSGMASLVRIMRGNMLEALGQPYILTARAKGLSEKRVVYIHALRNAINPMVTIFGYELSSLLSGAALVEIVTSYPGLGRLMLEAVLGQDLYLVMGSLLMGSVLLIMGNLVADIMLALVDPRIRQA